MNMTRVGVLGFAKQKNEDDKGGGWVLQNKRMNMNTRWEWGCQVLQSSRIKIFKKKGLVKFKDEDDKKMGGVGLCKLDLGQDNKGGKGDLNFAKLKDKDK